MQTHSTLDAVTSSKDAAPGLPLRLCGLATGARLLTPDGYQTVQTLTVGTQVRVLLRGQSRFEPITQIGRRDVILSRHRQSEGLVRIRKHAVANNVPERDVYLAPAQAIYLNGVLVESDRLVNGGSIVHEKRWRSVTYWGVSLARHNVMLADGLAVESLLPIHAHPFGAVVPSPPREPPPHPDATVASLDIGAETSAVLTELSATLLAHAVRVDPVIQPALQARMPSAAFRKILSGLLEHAITSAPRSVVRLTGAPHPNGQEVTISFGSAAPNLDVHRANLRGIQALAALHGARVDVRAGPESGLTLQFRLIG